MQLLSFSPENELEKAIADAKVFSLPLPDLMKTIVKSDLLIPTKNEVRADGSGFEPLLFVQSGVLLVTAFSSLSRAGLHGHIATYILKMNATEFFLRVPRNYGFVLNPGYTSQLMIPPAGVADLKRDLAVAKM